MAMFQLFFSPTGIRAFTTEMNPKYEKTHYKKKIKRIFKSSDKRIDYLILNVF